MTSRLLLVRKIDALLRQFAGDVQLRRRDHADNLDPGALLLEHLHTFNVVAR